MERLKRKQKSPAEEESVAEAEQLTQAPVVTPERVKIDEALAAIPCDAFIGPDRWAQVVNAIHAATGGNEEGFEIATDWCHEWFFYKPEDLRRQWDGCGKHAPEGVDGETLFKMAVRVREHAEEQARKKLERDTRLAELAKTKKKGSRTDYDIERKKLSEELDVRVSSIDADVGKICEEEELEEVSEFLQAVEPWPEPVDGAALLDSICKVYKAHIVMRKMCDITTGLWTLHVHAHDAAQHSPILFITSPTKRCGKTNLLATAARLVPLPLSAANITPATTFRSIDYWHPTMLIDEMDTFLSDKSDLRGILNSGHTRSGAFVLRCVGDDLVPKQFSTWCPKVFASIGRMHPTLEDRSITIGLKRKMPTEKIERIPKDPKAYEDLRRKCVRWAGHHMEELRNATPKVPEGLNDRARDNWEPLLAIAEACGGEWPEKAREAALRLSGLDEDETFSIQLLQDFEMLFAEAKGKNLSSAWVASELGGMEDRPWPAFERGQPITTHGIAKLLKDYKIAPRQVLVRGQQKQGYRKEQFKWVFKRYLGRGE